MYKEKKMNLNPKEAYKPIYIKVKGNRMIINERSYPYTVSIGEAFNQKEFSNMMEKVKLFDEKDIERINTILQLTKNNNANIDANILLRYC